jgi:hypothetical protein
MFAAEDVKYCRHSDIEDEIARLIADGIGVARFAGILNMDLEHWAIARSCITPATLRLMIA